MTPARRRFETVVAEQAALAAGSDTVALRLSSPYDLMLLQLSEDRRQLKALQSIEAKIQLKRILLPKYEPYVTGILAGGKGAQDDVLMTVMLWRLDAGDFPGALIIGGYALHYGLVMPDQYKRDTATVIAEEIALGALALLAKESADTTGLLDSLLLTQELTAKRDMPDEVRARLHKATGYGWRGVDPAQAIAELKRALSLHDKVGVKKDIEQLERELKKAAQSSLTES